MSLPERGIGIDDLDNLAPPPFIQSDSLRTVMDPLTYADNTYPSEANAQPDRYLYHLDEGLPIKEAPEEVKLFLKEYFESGLAYYDLTNYPKIDMSPAIGFIRDRFGLTGDSQVIFSPGGSDPIIKQLVNLFPKGDFELTVLGPTFQTIVNSANQVAPENVKRIESDLSLGMRPTVREAMLRASESNESKNRIFYMCNPSTPTGEVLSVTEIEHLAYVCAENGITLVVDEVAGDFTPVSNSIIKLTEDLPNMIGIRSFSKGMHLPALPGWAVMSKIEGDRFNNTGLPFSDRVNPMGMRLANRLFDPEIYIPHLEEVGEQVTLVKSHFIKLIRSFDIEVFPTDDRVIFSAIKGRKEDFYQKVDAKGIKVVDGSTFKGTHSSMDKSIIRISTPSTIEEASEVALLLSDANEEE